MNGSLRIKVIEGYDVLITVHKISGDFSVSYLAKNTLIHKNYCLLGITHSILYHI